MAASQKLAPFRFGWEPSVAATNNSTLALSAANLWQALSFVADGSKTFTKFRHYLASKTGTLATTDLVAALYSDNGGKPNAQLDVSNADSVPAGGNWVNWSGFTGTALTDGTMYWVVLKNLNSLQTSNFPTYYDPASGELPTYVTSAGSVSFSWGFGYAKTADGTTWTTVRPSVAGPRFGFSDSTYQGFPLQTYTRPSSVTSTAMGFGVQEVGAKFVLPANAKFYVKGISAAVAKVGSPGSLRYRLYNGTTLIGTTDAVPAANVGTGNGPWYIAYFPSPIAIDSSMTAIRAVVGDATAGDTSSNGYAVWQWVTENDANSTALMPCDGTWGWTITTNNAATPPVFTDTANQFLAMVLLLDTNGGFQAGAGGGGGRATLLVG